MMDWSTEKSRLCADAACVVDTNGGGIVFEFEANGYYRVLEGLNAVMGGRYIFNYAIDSSVSGQLTGGLCLKIEKCFIEMDCRYSFKYSTFFFPCYFIVQL